MTHFSMCTCAAAITSTPLRPWGDGLPTPGLSIDRFRRWTMAVAELTMMPFTPAASTPPIEPPEPSIVIDLVMVTAPKPPGSSTSMNPPTAVWEIAPANVLHGAVRLHGFASLPTPDTQVRVACACAAVAVTIISAAQNATVRICAKYIFFMTRSLRK
jgi:hypothetical protein